MTRNNMMKVLDASGVAEKEQDVILDKVKYWTCDGLLNACHKHGGEGLCSNVRDVARALYYW